MVEGVKAFAVAAALGCVVAAVGLGRERQLGRHVAQEQKNCEVSLAVQKPEDFRFTCDLADYRWSERRLPDPKPGDVRYWLMFDALDSAVKAEERFDVVVWYMAGIGVALLGALPYLWYFFLRRIRELRSAITGG